jgi:hypothetical protein
MLFPVTEGAFLRLFAGVFSLSLEMPPSGGFDDGGTVVGGSDEAPVALRDARALAMFSAPSPGGRDVAAVGTRVVRFRDGDICDNKQTNGI